MERRVIIPWAWQDNFGFSQAVEVKNAERTIYCAGQSSNDANGNVMHVGDMRGQIKSGLG